MLFSGTEDSRVADVIALVSILFFVLVAVLSEQVGMKRVKSQTGLRRLVAIFGITGLMNTLWCLWNGVSLVVAVVFWAGVFAAWFVVRSHLESSIFLRMLRLLRGRDLPADELLREYELIYGWEARVKELLQAGLIEGEADDFRVTRKGRIVLGVRRCIKG